MMFSTRAEYGVRVMVELARRGADGDGLPLAYLEHLAARLRKAGLVESRRGARGGYLLARPAKDISMAEVVERVLAAVREGRRITVHGDFDVDGVCATTVMVSTLRDLGADCDWLIPDRLADGYGLSTANVERLAQRGTSLLITVDCGITAAAEVHLAQELGMAVVVTAHHQPGAELPACPILHPSLDGYPFADLCGTAVASKLDRKSTRLNSSHYQPSRMPSSA